MTKRALIFADRHSLAGALKANLLKPKLLGRTVHYQRLDDGELAVSAQGITATALSHMNKLGIETRDLSGNWCEAPCWPSLLPPTQRSADTAPNEVLIALPRKDLVLPLIAELLRLGCDRASYSVIKRSKSNVAALVRAWAPPFYTVVRGSEDPDRASYVPITSNNEQLWIAYGYTHDLAQTTQPRAGTLIVIDRSGVWHTLQPGPWVDILDIVDVTISGRKVGLAAETLTKRLNVPLRLRPASREDAATLWVLDKDPDTQLESLLSCLPNDVVSRLVFAVGHIDGERSVVLRARPGRQGPPQIDVAGRALVPYAGIANLHVPVGYAIEPPLRRDRLRAELTPDATRVVWVTPDNSQQGTFGLDSIDEAAFSPLADWVDYTVSRARAELEPWVASATFDTDAFRSIGGEWSRTVETDATPQKSSPTSPQQSRSTTTEPVTVLGGLPSTTPAAPASHLPKIATGDRSREQLLAELERQFLDMEQPADDPARRSLWQSMTRLHIEMGNEREAALCITRAMWDASDADAAALATAFVSLADDGVVLTRLKQCSSPTPGQVRSVIAQLVAAAATNDEPSIDLADALVWLNNHDGGLDVRSVWLGRSALSSLAGGDRLALARTRDRILRQLRGGLSLERDVPTFLRFVGSGAGDSATVGELARHLSGLYDYFTKTKRKRSPVEAAPSLTHTYVAFEFAYGLARLGQAERATDLRDQAQQAIENPDSIHRFLIRAFVARIDQALEGQPAGTALPPDIAAQLNELSKFERYKVDRLRQASTVLEPQERLDPVAAFQRGDKDPRGDEFIQLRGQTDIQALAKDIRHLLAVARADDTDLEDRARLLDGLMDFFPLLGEADAVFGLEQVLGAVNDIEPKRRALLLEEALMLAGYFGRDHTCRHIASELDTIFASLQSDDVLSLAEEFATCMRSMRRVGLADQALALLDKLSDAITGDSTTIEIARLHVAAGRAYLGDFEHAEPVLLHAQQLVGKDSLVAAERLRIISALAAAWTHAPTERASQGLRDLAKLFSSITDSYNTNSHFCLSVISFVDSLVLGFASGELALGDVGRRWLDEDEYLIRRRIHHELHSETR